MSVHTFSCLDGHTCGNPVRLVSGGAPLAQGRHHERAAARFPRQPRLDPQGADVRAARPRRDVGLDALSADPRRLRHRHPVHRGERLPADVRPRHDRHRHHGGRERAGGAGDAGRRSTSMRRPAAWWRATSSTAASSKACASPTSPRISPPARSRSTCPAWASWCSISPTAATSTPSSSRRRILPASKSMSAGDVLRLSPIVRRLVNDKIQPVHPENPTIKGVSHVMWTGKPRDPRAHARNAVFYGDKAIDRSPCGTGTSARMAQLAARGRLKVGDEFVHESIIGSLFDGRVEGAGARRQPRRHRALDRRLGAPARHQHHLRRRPRSLRARLPGA